MLICFQMAKMHICSVLSHLIVPRKQYFSEEFSEEHLLKCYILTSLPNLRKVLGPNDFFCSQDCLHKIFLQNMTPRD